MLDVPSLAQKCREQTDRFFRRATADNQYCFELFRRAILYKNEYAWSLLIRQYTPLATGWVLRHEQFPQMADSADEFVSRAFLQFWQALDSEKFTQFASLEALLRYLKMCTWSAVAMEARKKRVQSVELDDARTVVSGADPSATLQSDALWDAIQAVCKNDAERHVAECAFVFEMKAGEIASAYPELFQSVKQVYRVKENLTARLRRNAAILAILQGDA